eukprot:CAMPEP_0174914014 /NCGR_PEP_ID=MMETSP0167-20121228/80617_1 /TAXON_ID=38298 /ORGANISM="Rhodella maculata, Strain CCMP736" /LENGTH=339 /DNA_ID=CAMNT_0016158761 /DNA_START=905 /DNA_END=1926 /DNA_ORIENTATION=-
MFVDKNNFMQAFGLVGASHLNGKFGVIIEDASDSTNGRMTVQFWDETPAGFVDHPGPPKLVKPQNLKSVSIPMGKNHPGFSYLHGNEKVMVRVENGAGKSCVDCGCDLELNCFVFYNDEYRCEKDFAVSVGKSSTCEVCGDHLPLREVEHLPFGVMERYFPGKIPKDNPNSFSSYPVHRNCFVCCLCERYPSQDIFVGDQYPGPPHISELTGKAGFLCKKLPKSTTSCVEEYDDYLATKERQHVLDLWESPSQDIFDGDQYPGPPHISELTGKAGVSVQNASKVHDFVVEEYDEYFTTKKRQLVIEKLPLDALQSTLVPGRFLLRQRKQGIACSHNNGD